ncbi:MAG TPA: gonadoliberin III, partial [Halieaceae bacterium]|nr:gonadoliberin III [Halieaceae bacterium]
MNPRATFFATVALLAASGILVAILRFLETGTPFLPGQERSVWQVEARVDLVALGGPVS